MRTYKREPKEIIYISVCKPNKSQ